MVKVLNFMLSVVVVALIAAYLESPLLAMIGGAFVGYITISGD